MFCLCTSSRLSFFLERWKSRQPPASIVFGLRRIGVARRQIPYYVNINSIQAYSHDYDPSKELLGLEVDPQSRNLIPSVPKAKSWFGPNGQYIRELPCPCCRGRGYTPCPECGVDRSRSDCSQCNGKGVKTCWQCLGECVIWEESYDERPWEKARSSSLFKVKEDDEVDSLEIKTEDTRPSKRVYQTPSREVSLKISRTLRSLNAKTGLFSKRMKIIHQDPVLHAQRVAAIKISKRTPAARKRASDISKAYFSNPENRLKRSLAMKGVKFYCSHCGEEGHRRHYCAALRKTSTVMRFKCSFCGEKGHNRRSCERSTVMMTPKTIHQSTTHPQPFNFMAGSSGSKVMSTAKSKRSYFCKLCFCKGHNIRTCPNKEMPVEMHTKTAPPEQ